MKLQYKFALLIFLVGTLLLATTLGLFHYWHNQATMTEATLTWLLELGLLLTIALAIFSLMVGRLVTRLMANLAPADQQLTASTFPLPLQVAGNREATAEIAAQQQIEASLHALLSRQEDLINTVDGILWEADATTFMFTFVSRQAEVILGYPLRQWLEQGDFWPQHIHPDDQGWAVDYCLQQTHQALNHVFEYRMIAADGKIVWLRDVVVVVSEGGQVKWLRGLMVDITQRKESEAKLKESEERYRSLVENTNDGYWMWEMRENRMLFSNQRLCTLLGCSYTSLQEIDPWEIFDREEKKLTKQSILDWWTSPRTDSHRQVVSLRHQNGSTIRVEVTSSKIMFHGSLMHQGIVRDVTEEERLSRQLEHSQRLEAIGTLAGGIAHDFNNVLGVVIGFSELAKMELPGHQKVLPYLDQILAAGLRAREVVAQLLTFSRRQPTEKKPVLLVAIVKEATRFIRATLPANIEIITNLPPGNQVVLANATQLNQVLLNLYSNAGHAMGERGGLLKITLQTVTLQHPAETPLDLAPGTYSLIQVEDNGPGMDSQVKSRIFDPFFTTKKTGQGTGLGLSVVHGIIANHGGGVGVESQVGVGSIFSIYLPEIAAPPAKEATVSGPLIQGQGKHILVVDDEPQLLYAMNGMLTSLGYRITTTNHPLQALETFMADENSIHVVITDMAMPGMLGTELAERLRQVRSNIPIIICTGCSNPLEQEETDTKEGYGFLQKPFAITDLSRALEQLNL